MKTGFVSVGEMEASTTRLLEKLYNDREMITGVASGHVDLDRISRIVVQAGHIPYYFALWHDEAKVTSRRSTGDADELQIRLDDCNGPTVKAVPLRSEHPELETLDIALDGNGVHDVCFAFAAHARDPLWLIDFVRLVPK